MKLKLFAVLWVAVVVLMLAGCGAPAAPAPTPTPTVHPGQALVSSRCIGCHELNRISNAAYDQEGWQLTVDRMVLSGAQLSPEQVPMVVEYLAQAYPRE